MQQPDDTAAPEPDPLAAFHPAVRAWFAARFPAPTDAQREGWPAIRSGRDVLIAAPTGSGKTLAAFLAGIDALYQEAAHDALPDHVAILYVSPLKALGNDIARNLDEPLAGIVEAAERIGVPVPRLRTAVRSGDTPPAERAAILRRPPHLLITTPESLYLLLTSERGRATLAHVRTVIVDEIHALARDQRGTHLALSLARLDRLVQQAGHTRPARIGLSATQRPIEELAAFLVGTLHVYEGAAECVVIDRGHQRDLDLAVEVPPSALEAVAPREQWSEVYDRLAALVREHRTTLIFVNNRRLSERAAHELAQRLGADTVASHHGSVARERRLHVEQRLKSGDLRALVATASLELGIDIGAVDLVCQIGSPKGIATFLQRVGRAGHAVGARSTGRLFPTTRDELVECAALVRAVHAGRLDRVTQPVAPLDVLAQQIVAACACEPWAENALFALVCEAWPYRALTREAFDDVIEMLSTGIGEGAGRAAPLLHRDRIHGVLHARRGARLIALTNGGTIPDVGEYRVIAEPDDAVVGTVNEDFAVESMAGDVFLLGSTSWRIKRVETSTVRVEDARGAPPSVPFWLGEHPGRTFELSEEVSSLRADVGAALDDAQAAHTLLRDACGVDAAGARQIADYLRATRDGLGLVPTQQDVVFERFFDENGSMQLVVHAPFGARINRAWGLTLRKRFCVQFDFELQAAASDDAILLSLGPQHSFPLEESFQYVTTRNAQQSLEQSILYMPLFGTRFRWAATRALAVPRQRGGRRVAPFVQRMRANDLIAAVFPQQVGCQENVTGPLEIPDHPLIAQAVDDCVHQSMDLDGLLALLSRIEAGTVRLHARDTTEPSPLAHEIVTGRPYTYLDNAPLEERRTRAVTLRRGLPEHMRDLGALDADAIDRVRDEAWPSPRHAEEVHEALQSLVLVADDDVPEWAPLLETLRDNARAAVAEIGERRYWFAAELMEAVRLLLPHAILAPALVIPPAALEPIADREAARARLLRGLCEALGPTTTLDLARRTGLTAQDAEWGLAQLEAGGFVLRGSFTPGHRGDDEWCDRRLLARIHRYTLDRLRREIDPVPARDFMRFLLRWQHVTPETALEGRGGVRAALDQLAGFEAPARAWEQELLPARVRDYTPSWLDQLCLGGEATWARLSPPAIAARLATAAATRATPLAVLPRSALTALLAATRGDTVEPAVTGAAAEVLQVLRARGALFLDEITAATRRLPTDVESGLRVLVAAGLAHADGFQALRRLAGLSRATARVRRHRTSLTRGLRAGGEPVGRWAAVPVVPVEAAAATGDMDADPLAEAVAEALLRRYGVVFRDLLARESFTVPWRDVQRALRRMEARGTVRGGRFVTGFLGEQYALPEAVDALRRVRREPQAGERVTVAATDPLNLIGIIVPGDRVAALPGRTVTYIDGMPADLVPVPWAALTGPGR